MHPAGLDVVGVEPARRQRPQEAVLGREPLGRFDTGRAVPAVMHPFVDPQPCPPVQRVEIVGDAGDDELLEEALGQVTERSLDLALAFRVTGLAGLDLGAVMTGELERRRMQLEPASLRLTERAHPVRATHLRDTAGGLEEPDDAFERVLPIDAAW